MKWYTAIGVKKSGMDGRFCVAVMKEEKVLTGMEIEIWSAMLWAFCEEQDVMGRVMGLLRIAFGEEEAQKVKEAEFRYCLRRLETRGLIAAGEGETAEEAVEGLMRRVTMVRAQYPLRERLAVFWNSLSMGKGLRFSLRALKKHRLTPAEESLLKRLDADGRIDSHLKLLEDHAKQVAELVVVEDTGFERSVQQDFIADVIALYGRKQLLIERIRKEEIFEEMEEAVL